MLLNSNSADMRIITMTAMMRILIGTTIRRITVIIHRVKTMMIMGMQHYSPHDSRNYYYSLVKSSMLLSSFVNEGEGEN